MPPKARRKWVFGLWMVAFWVCIVGAVVTFARVAPWTTAMSPAEAEAEWPGKIDPSWQAVLPNHGRPKEWPHGTIAEDPAAFAKWMAGLVAALGGVCFCYWRMKWYIEPPERI